MTNGEIKARGRQYAKARFHLNEDDYIELSECETSYLAGYKFAIKEQRKNKKQ